MKTALDIAELIRSAGSATEVLTALSVYADEALRHLPALPDGCLAPLQSEADVRERVAVLIGIVNLTSRNFRAADCRAAKSALRVFAAALARLDPRAKAER